MEINDLFLLKILNGLSILCCRHKLSLFWTTVSGRTFITFVTNINRLKHRTQLFPNGYICSRPDSVYSDRMQDIRGVQAGLYSCAVGMTRGKQLRQANCSHKQLRQFDPHLFRTAADLDMTANLIGVHLMGVLFIFWRASHRRASSRRASPRDVSG